MHQFMILFKLFRNYVHRKVYMELSHYIAYIANEGCHIRIVSEYQSLHFKPELHIITEPEAQRADHESGIFYLLT